MDGGAGTAGTAGAAGTGGGGPTDAGTSGCGKPWTGSDITQEMRNGRAPMQVAKRTIVIGTATREYLVAVPKTYDSSKPYPLVIGLHGSGGNRDQLRGYMDVETPANQGAVFIYPTGTPQSDGGVNEWDLSATSVDLTLIDSLIAQYSSELCIDQKRIFATGHSFGGCMSNALGCFGGKPFRAIAPVAGCAARQTGCTEESRRSRFTAEGHLRRVQRRDRRLHALPACQHLRRESGLRLLRRRWHHRHHQAVQSDGAGALSNGGEPRRDDHGRHAAHRAKLCQLRHPVPGGVRRSLAPRKGNGRRSGGALAQPAPLGRGAHLGILGATAGSGNRVGRGLAGGAHSGDLAFQRRPAARNAFGVVPVQRRKARVKLAASE